MQAPVFKRTTPNRIIGLALGIGLAASLAFSAATLTRSNNEVRQDAIEAAAGVARVHVPENAGEGRVGPTISRSAATLVAHFNPYAGEGRDNVAARRAAESLPFITYAAPLGMGEGWLGGVTIPATTTSPALIAYSSCGQGEGLLQQGVHVEHTCR